MGLSVVGVGVVGSSVVASLVVVGASVVVAGSVVGASVSGASVVVVVGGLVGTCPLQVDWLGQSQILSMSFHSNPAGQSLTVGLPVVLSALTSQWMNLEQSSGYG